MFRPVQIGINSSDIAGSLRLYHEAFGYVNAGGNGFWGAPIKVQGHLPDARALVWWLIGGQPLFQLEFFLHTNPAQRPVPSSWRPCDLGWVRIGIAVADFDACVAGLSRNGVELIRPPMGHHGSHRAAYRDPFHGSVVEAIEDIEAARDSLPAVRYVTLSVASLEDARRHYTALGLKIVSDSLVRPAEDEALWGLPDATRAGFIVEAGDMEIEVVRYADPVGRPRPADYRQSDQGIVNVAFMTREPEEFFAVLNSIKSQGHEPPYVIDTPELKCAYIVDPGRETELISCPEHLDAIIGFTPAMPFLSTMDE